MQLIQNKPDELTIRIVPGRNYNEGREQELIDYFKAVFGEQTVVSIRSVDAIPLEPNGKYRFSICKIRN